MNPLVFLAQTLRIAIPYLFAASGGVICRARRVVAWRSRASCSAARSAPRSAATTRAVAWVGILGGLAAVCSRPAARGGDDSLSRRSGRRRHRDQSAGGRCDAVLSSAAFDSSSNSPRIPGLSSAGGGLRQSAGLAGCCACRPGCLMTHAVRAARARGGRASAAAASAGLPVGSCAISRCIVRHARRARRRVPRARPAPVHRPE